MPRPSALFILCGFKTRGGGIEIRFLGIGPNFFVNIITNIITNQHNTIMKLNLIKKQAALTLIEVTLVIAVLLGLISVLFIGVSAYREGSNRAGCILNISNVQKAVRSYQNLYELSVDDALVSSTLIGNGKMLQTAPSCRSGGAYTYRTTVPPVGTAYVTCSRGTSHNHRPASVAGW
jgi:competence protein ComGC